MSVKSFWEKISEWVSDNSKYIISVPALIAAIWLTVWVSRRLLCSSRGKLAVILILVLWGIFIIKLIAPFVGRFLGNSNIIPSKDKSQIPYKLLSPIVDLVAEKQYPEAVKKLNSLLKKYPFNPQALLILVQIQVEVMNNHRLALELIEEYFTQPNVTPAEENIEMLSICAGICEDENLIPKVRGLLEYELKRKGYSDSDRKRIVAQLKFLDEKEKLD